jgi:hypothetical protein
MKLKALTEVMTAAGIPPVVFRHHNGGSILVSPYGARVLGVYTHADAENAFWTNHEFATADTLKKWISEPNHVFGGDRLWLAPERGLFFKGVKEADGVAVCPQIDPGHYVVGGKSGNHIRMVASMTAPYHLAKGARVRAHVERTIRLCHSPFADTPTLLPVLPRVKFAGYEIATRFELQESPIDTFYAGLWFLIQLPIAGYAYIPTYGKTVTTDYYEPTGPDYLRIDERHVRFRLDSVSRHKIGVRKTEVMGRIGYLKDEVAGQSLLVVRNFLNNPSGHYADVPLHTPAGTQDSIQCYNHLDDPRGFGEIEFHPPGVKRSMAEPVITDINQVWVFTGSRADLVQVASRLLGLPAQTFA